jgi:hypothetical protein
MVLLIAFILKAVNLVTRGEYYVAVGLHIPLILLFTATGALPLGVVRVPGYYVQSQASGWRLRCPAPARR